MANKRIKELRNLTVEELKTKIRETEAGLFQLKMRSKLGQLENTASLWQNRKDLARVKMLLTEKETSNG